MKPVRPKVMAAGEEDGNIACMLLEAQFQADVTVLQKERCQGRGRARPSCFELQDEISWKA